jgi:hypothetical protein
MAHIQETVFDGERAIEVVTSAFCLITIVDRGPRIAHFGAPDGENLLLWAPGKYRRGEWDLMVAIAFGSRLDFLTRPVTLSVPTIAFISP